MSLPSLPTYYQGAGILFAALDHDGQVRVLLGKRLHAPGAGFWSVPGGAMSPQDDGDLRACAAREVFEETVGLPKLDCLRLRLLDRLHDAPEHRVNIPLLYRWRTYLVILGALPPLDIWPNQIPCQKEFYAFEWFLPRSLPRPLHRFMGKTIRRFAPELLRMQRP
jgi:8-oxo-dGTP pyrophosphatase MutT (NUDIX family)